MEYDEALQFGYPLNVVETFSKQGGDDQKALFMVGMAIAERIEKVCQQMETMMVILDALGTQLTFGGQPTMFGDDPADIRPLCEQREGILRCQLPLDHEGAHHLVPVTGPVPGAESREGLRARVNAEQFCGRFVLQDKDGTDWNCDLPRGHEGSHLSDAFGKQWNMPKGDSYGKDQS